MSNGDHMTTYIFDEQILSDLHKDAYGSRPGQRFWQYWNQSSDEWKQRIWDGLLEDLDIAMREQTERESQALINLNELISQNMRHGAKDREQAIKWVVESLDPDHQDLCYGGSWVCYMLGLAYSQQHLFDQACIELRYKMEDA
jgi:hypothetical protein